MQPTQPNLFLRNDTFLGVCEALGQDFRMNPIYLRVALAGLFFFYPLATMAGYLALGAVVAVTRWLAPDRLADATQSFDRQPLPHADNAEGGQLPIAA